MFTVPLFSMQILDQEDRNGCSLSSCGRQQRIDGRKLLACSACNVARYCCKEHQRKAWPDHKTVCRKLKQKGNAHEGGTHQYLWEFNLALEQICRSANARLNVKNLEGTLEKSKELLQLIFRAEKEHGVVLVDKKVMAYSRLGEVHMRMKDFSKAEWSYKMQYEQAKLMAGLYSCRGNERGLKSAYRFIGGAPGALILVFRAMKDKKAEQVTLAALKHVEGEIGYDPLKSRVHLKFQILSGLDITSEPESPSVGDYFCVTARNQYLTTKRVVDECTIDEMVPPELQNYIGFLREVLLQGVRAGELTHSEAHKYAIEFKEMGDKGKRAIVQKIHREPSWMKHVFMQTLPLKKKYDDTCKETLCCVSEYITEILRIYSDETRQPSE